MFRKIRLKKPNTQPLPLETQELVTRTGDMPITWNTVAPVPYNEETWLMDTVPGKDGIWSNDTRPLATEPQRKLSGETLPLVLRLCDCGLANGQECNCPIATS